jgi:hypothetical protein
VRHTTTNRTLISLALAGSLTLAVQAQGQNDAIKAEVLKVEGQRVQALLQVDVAALDRILSNDLTYTHASAVVNTKAEYIERVKSGQLKYETIEQKDVNVRVYGNTVILNGTSMQGTKAQPSEMRFTTVYVKLDGRWQQVAWQSTRAPQPQK